MGVSNSSGWRRMFLWGNILELLVDHGLTTASPFLLQRLRTRSSSDMKKTVFWCGLSSLTLVRMLERYFSLAHSSIASPRRAEFGFWELFKASISAETVWIWSTWKIKTNMDLKVKETEKDSKTSKQGSFWRGGVFKHCCVYRKCAFKYFQLWNVCFVAPLQSNPKSSF